MMVLYPILWATCVAILNVFLAVKGLACVRVCVFVYVFVSVCVCLCKCVSVSVSVFAVVARGLRKLYHNRTNYNIAVDGMDSVNGKVLTCAFSCPEARVDVWAPPLDTCRFI